MAKPVSFSSKPLRNTLSLLLLAMAFGCAMSARILNEVDPQTPFPANPQQASSDPSETDDPEVGPVGTPSATLPSGSSPATSSTNTPSLPDGQFPPEDVPDEPTIPVPPPPTTAAADPAPATGPPPATNTANGEAAADQEHPQLTFFMHDILGGSHPSGRVVTGIVANSDVNNLPFSKPNNQVFPIQGGVPLNTINGIINNNNYPFLVGLNGSPTNTVLQNNVNTANNLPFVTAGQLPAGLSLQKIMFGSVTVVDNELTEGHELGSAVLGRGQGFYLASSLDGSSHTLVLTALFHGGDHHDHEVEDTISFFGVHRTPTPDSQIAIVGGTGKYENAKGYATIVTLPQHDQHTTDGVETITQFSVYLTQ